MSRVIPNDYTHDILRGWPNGEAIQMNMATKVPVGNGDFVKITANGPVPVGTAATRPGALPPAANDVFGLVVRGENDTNGSGRENLQKTVVPNIILLSNFVVRTTAIKAGHTIAAGTPVFIDANGLLDGNQVGGAPAFGTCIEVHTDGGAGGDAIVVLVK